MAKENKELWQSGKFRYHGSDQVRSYDIYKVRINGESWYELHIEEEFETDADSISEALDYIKELGVIL